MSDNASTERPKWLPLVLNAAMPGEPATVLVLKPGGQHEQVSSWRGVIELVLRYQSEYELAVDPQQAEQIARILNGKP